MLRNANQNWTAHSVFQAVQKQTPLKGWA
jgi:hypothetical protein